MNFTSTKINCMVIKRSTNTFKITYNFFLFASVETDICGKNDIRFFASFGLAKSPGAYRKDIACSNLQSDVGPQSITCPML